MFARLDERGAVMLPEELREGLAPDTPFEAVRREDSVIELRPHERDPEQAWFWSEHWQQMEREDAADIAGGRVKTFDDKASFLADLDADDEEQCSTG